MSAARPTSRLSLRKPDEAFDGAEHKAIPAADAPPAMDKPNKPEQGARDAQGWSSDDSSAPTKKRKAAAPAPKEEARPAAGRSGGRRAAQPQAPLVEPDDSDSEDSEEPRSKQKAGKQRAAAESELRLAGSGRVVSRRSALSSILASRRACRCCRGGQRVRLQGLLRVL
jgi:hypothetical protein